MSGLIYIYVNNLNGKVYVGQSYRPRDRHNTHRSRARRGIKHPFYSAVRKYGWDNFSCHEILVDSLGKLNNLEKLWIICLRANSADCGYNLSEGGDAQRGWKHSAEWREWARQTRKGENNAFFGKTHTDEVRKKVSLAQKGRPGNKNFRHKPETLEKLSQILRGRKLPPRSPEYCRKLSENKKAWWAKRKNNGTNPGIGQKN